MITTAKKKELNFAQCVCLVYIAQLFVFVVHMIDAWHPFMFNWIDWILYMLCISMDAIASRCLDDFGTEDVHKKLKGKFFKLFSCELVIFIVDMFADYILWAFVPFLIAFIAKYVILCRIPLNVFKYISNQFAQREEYEGVNQVNKYKKQSIIIGVFLIVFLVLQVFKNDQIWAYVGSVSCAILWVVNFISSAKVMQEKDDYLKIGKMVKNTESEVPQVEKIFIDHTLDNTSDGKLEYKEEVEEVVSVKKERTIKVAKKLFKVCCAVYGIAVLMSFVGQNIYHGGEYYLYDENGNKVSEQSSATEFYSYWGGSWRDSECPEVLSFDYYIYTEENIMPKWTGLHKSRCGLMREDGKTNGKKYSSYLFTPDRNGCLPDGEGHIIDVSGNIITDMPYSYKAKISNRTKLIRALFPCNYSNKLLWGTNGGYEDYGIYRLGTYNYISEKGRIKYYSEVFNGRGVCDSKGRGILSPEYEYIDVSADLDIMLVADRSYSFGFYDNYGNCLTDKVEIDTCNIVPDAGLAWYEVEVYKSVSYSHDDNGSDPWSGRGVIVDYQGNILEEKVDISSGTRYDEYITYYKNGAKYHMGADHVAHKVEEKDE
ncbi:hypothetical protein [Pseudobutyrivibrio sp.]|uniref:hypothetical protein n=1 Tax=Pseudobutyrivibrio sp. TaxID=2014367 RepID=UPI0025E45498|nr:hypothetical protein [Pseudobutyrivibrio sp.]MBR5650250.1 hypothetical protein [Pseudobutyrivibrio sp.]